MENNMKAFIVTSFTVTGENTERGVYLTEKKAIAACINKMYEYCEVPVDKKFNGAHLDWINPTERELD